ncbi:TOBE domain-containing protein, partial [Escherichia coli]|uniref:TOBE domain-containing protein n=1 Tax=Escherichia coli TaxID=562 RepID=UPI003D81664B
LILLKAPWVGITQDEAVAQNADNQLPGIISHIERGAEQCEVLMALPDGQLIRTFPKINLNQTSDRFRNDCCQKYLLCRKKPEARASQ